MVKRLGAAIALGWVVTALLGSLFQLASVPLWVGFLSIPIVLGAIYLRSRIDTSSHLGTLSSGASRLGRWLLLSIAIGLPIALLVYSFVGVWAAVLAFMFMAAAVAVTLGFRWAARYIRTTLYQNGINDLRTAVYASARLTTALIATIIAGVAAAGFAVASFSYGLPVAGLILSVLAVVALVSVIRWARTVLLMAGAQSHAQWTVEQNLHGNRIPGLAHAVTLLTNGHDLVSYRVNQVVLSASALSSASISAIGFTLNAPWIGALLALAAIAFGVWLLSRRIQRTQNQLQVPLQDFNPNANDVVGSRDYRLWRMSYMAQQRSGQNNPALPFIFAMAASASREMRWRHVMLRSLRMTLWSLPIITLGIGILYNPFAGAQYIITSLLLVAGAALFVAAVLFVMGLLLMVYRERTVYFYGIPVFLALFGKALVLPINALLSWIGLTFQIPFLVLPAFLTEPLISSVPFTSVMSIGWILITALLFLIERQHVAAYFRGIRNGHSWWAPWRWPWQFEDTIGLLPHMDRRQGRPTESSIGGARMDPYYVDRTNSRLAELRAERAQASYDRTQRSVTRFQSQPAGTPMRAGVDVAVQAAVPMASTLANETQLQAQATLPVSLQSLRTYPHLQAGPPAVRTQRNRWERIFLMLGVAPTGRELANRLIFQRILPLILILLSFLAGAKQDGWHLPNLFGPAGVETKYTASTTGQKVNAVKIVDGPNNQRLFMADNKEVKNGGNAFAYQATDGTRSPGDYAGINRLCAMYAALLPAGDPVLAEVRRSMPLSWQGTIQGKDHANILVNSGNPTIVIYNPPVDNDTDFDLLNKIFNRAYDITGGKFHVIIGDSFGLDAPGSKLDWAKQSAHAVKLAQRFKDQAYFLAMKVPNEAELHINVGNPTAYYVMVEALIGLIKQTWHQGGVQTTRPVGLSTSETVSWDVFVRLENADFVSINVFQFNNYEAIRVYMEGTQIVNQRRALAGRAPIDFAFGEMGALAPQIAGMRRQSNYAELRKEDIRRQLRILRDPKYKNFLFRGLFEFANEGWKTQQEGEGADHYGIYDELGVDFLNKSEFHGPISLVTPSLKLTPDQEKQLAQLQASVAAQQGKLVYEQQRAAGYGHRVATEKARYAEKKKIEDLNKQRTEHIVSMHIDESRASVLVSRQNPDGTSQLGIRVQAKEAPAKADVEETKASDDVSVLNDAAEQGWMAGYRARMTEKAVKVAVGSSVLGLFMFGIIQQVYDATVHVVPTSTDLVMNGMAGMNSVSVVLTLFVGLIALSKLAELVSSKPAVRLGARESSA